MNDKNNVSDIGKKEDPIAAIFNEAAEEVNKEARKTAKRKIKQKLEEKKAAQKVLANIEREIAELKIEIRDDLGL